MLLSKDQHLPIRRMQYLLQKSVLKTYDLRPFASAFTSCMDALSLVHLSAKKQSRDPEYFWGSKKNARAQILNHCSCL
jgi:hypothetical protein